MSKNPEEVKIYAAIADLFQQLQPEFSQLADITTHPGLSYHPTVLALANEKFRQYLLPHDNSIVSAETLRRLICLWFDCCDSAYREWLCHQAAATTLMAGEAAHAA